MTGPGEGGLVRREHINLNDHVGVRLDRPLEVAVVGAGARGSGYARLVAAQPHARIVAVAEPRPVRRERFATRHRLPADRVFSCWQEMLERPRLADLVIVATQDADHHACAVACAEHGYDMLLEKPMATSEQECVAIAEAACRTGVTVVVCHVMRYSPYTRRLVELLESGVVGDIVGVEHLEPVGFWHFAHSYVRGNWRRESESTFVLLAKSCHDIDWLGYLVGRPVRRVSSFGALVHFRPENRPPEAADRCLDCVLEPGCPYSAPRLYRAGLQRDGTVRLLLEAVTDERTEEALYRALAEGPYGRCVYACDNDVCDHQVVNLEYAGGITATFSLTAFSPVENRRTRIHGSRGQITGDGRYLEVFDFRSERTTVIDTVPPGGLPPGEHAGGDAGLVEATVEALHAGRPDLVLSGVEASLDSHRVVFAAERARRRGTVEHLVPTAVR